MQCTYCFLEIWNTPKNLFNLKTCRLICGTKFHIVKTMICCETLWWISQTLMFVENKHVWNCLHIRKAIWKHVLLKIFSLFPELHRCHWADNLFRWSILPLLKWCFKSKSAELFIELSLVYYFRNLAKAVVFYFTSIEKNIIGWWFFLYRQAFHKNQITRTVCSLRGDWSRKHAVQI